MAVDDTTATPTQASVREDAKAASKSAPTTVSHSQILIYNLAMVNLY